MDSKSNFTKYYFYFSYGANILVWLLFFWLVSYLIQDFLFPDDSVLFIFFCIQALYFVLWVIKWIPDVIYYNVIGKKIAIDGLVAWFEALKLPNRVYRNDDIYTYLDRLITLDKSVFFEEKDPYDYIDKKDHARIRHIAIELKLLLRVNGEEGGNIIHNMRYVDNFKAAYDIVCPPSKAEEMKL